DQADLDAEGVELPPEGFAEPLDGVLGRRVNRQGWEGDSPRNARNVDHAPAAGGAHRRQDGARDREQAEDVGLELLPNVALRLLFEDAGDGNAGIVYQRIDGAILQRELFQLFAYALRGDVQLLDAERNPARSGGALEIPPPAEVAHGSDHAV